MKIKLPISFLLIALVFLTGCNGYPLQDNIARNYLRDGENLYYKAQITNNRVAYQRAEYNFKKAVETNNSRNALFYLGEIYEKGLSGKKDKALSNKYMKQSADLGYYKAINKLKNQ